MLREALERPLVVIFEDLHWIDSETQALLDLLAESIARSRLLLLVNYRPEYRHEWANKSYYSQLRLAALGGESAAAMLTALLGDAVELAPLKRLIVERTEGNPFFIEEIVQTLFDDGALVRNGTVKVTRSLSQIRLPRTVQGILAARIDRLPSEHKQLLQRLAVVGRESPLSLVQRLTTTARPQVEQMLADLQSGEFIYEQVAAADTEYVFKHALTQEVAYSSILIERRKLLHERIGQTIEEVFAQQVDDHVTALAHHYSRSDNTEKAVEYLGRAGQQAIQRSAYVDAISSLTAAISLLQKLPESPEHAQRELPLQLALGSASIAAKGWAAHEVEQAYTRARQLCEQLGDPPELFPALLGLWAVHFLRAELRLAYELAERLRRRAQSTHDQLLLSYSHLALGNTSYTMGNLLFARDHLEAAIVLYKQERNLLGGVNAKVVCLSYAAATLMFLGYPDRALCKVNEALALAQELSHPFSLAFAELWVSSIHNFRRETRSAQETAERVLALSIEYGLTDHFAWATIQRGSAMTAQGLHEEGIARLQEGIAACRATGAQWGRPYFLCSLAEACMKAGRLDEGLTALAEALAAADAHEERNYEPEMHRLKGELLLRQDHSKTAEAQGCFQRAVEIARKQSAKSLELRATMSLVRLLDSQGRRDEAREMLADIYGWFTEGFDTADLEDAKALLDELSA